MIGGWQQFGRGEMPIEGQVLVYCRPFAPGGLAAALEHGDHANLVVAVYRCGLLIDQYGGTYGLPHGAEWTALPSSSARY